MRKGSYETHKSLWRALWVLQSPADFQDKFTHLFSYWGPVICQTRGRETGWTPLVQKPIPFWIGAFYISAVSFISKDHWNLASQEIQKLPSLQRDSFPQLSFPFTLYPSSLSVLIYFLIPQHGTLPGSKEGFSWHWVNPNSECSILEIREDWGPWSFCKAEEKATPLSLSHQPLLSSPGILQRSNSFIDTSSFSLEKNESMKQGRALESLCKNCLKKQALFIPVTCSWNQARVYTT